MNVSELIQILTGVTITSRSNGFWVGEVLISKLTKVVDELINCRTLTDGGLVGGELIGGGLTVSGLAGGGRSGGGLTGGGLTGGGLKLVKIFTEAPTGTLSVLLLYPETGELVKLSSLVISGQSYEGIFTVSPGAWWEERAVANRLEINPIGMWPKLLGERFPNVPVERSLESYPPWRDYGQVPLQRNRGRILAVKLDQHLPTREREELIIGMSLDKALAVQGRRQPLRAISLALSTVQAWERLFENQLIEKRDFLSGDAIAWRVILLELERLTRFLEVIMEIYRALGIFSLVALALELIETIRQLLFLICGNRFGLGALIIFGVNITVGETELKMIKVKLKEFEVDFNRLLKLGWYREVVQDRLEGLGSITRVEALEYNLMGPIAKAVGLDFDTRRDDLQVGFAVIKPHRFIRTNGDVVARVEIMIDEIKDGLRLIRENLVVIKPTEPWDKSVLEKLRSLSGETAAGIETAAGTVFTWWKVEQGKIIQVEYGFPGRFNLPALTLAAEGEKVGDLELILASLIWRRGDL